MHSSGTVAGTVEDGTVARAIEVYVENTSSSESDDDGCPICLEDAIHANTIATQCCNAKFCDTCLVTWLERSGNTCPTCRGRPTGPASECVNVGEWLVPVSAANTSPRDLSRPLSTVQVALCITCIAGVFVGAAAGLWELLTHM